MTGPTTDQIAERLREVQDRIRAAAGRAGRDPGDVRIVAVTKTFGPETVSAAVEAGLDAIGENRAQELLEKAAALDETGGPAPTDWHFVGRIQRNKVKKLASLVGWWHSVDRLRAGETIARHAPGARVFVQVNVGGEEQKGGCAPGETEALVGGLRDLDLEVEGLMTVPPFGEDPRPHFARLRELAADVGVSALSMGMSGDYEIAVEEGATVVRLGTTLFGARDHG